MALTAARQGLDLRGVFDAEAGATFAEDAVHYSGLGNRVLAEALASAVIDELGRRARQ